MSLSFFGREYISRQGVKFSKILRGVAHKEGSDRSRIFLAGLGKKGWGQYFRLGLIPWRTLLVRSTVIMTWNKFITKWNLAHVFMVILEVISQKSAKIHREFFYHIFKLWTKIFLKNCCFSYEKLRKKDKYIAYFEIFQLF